MVRSNLGNSFDVLIEREGSMSPRVLTAELEEMIQFVKSSPHLIKEASLSSGANDQHHSFIQIIRAGRFQTSVGMYSITLSYLAKR